jgi:hypothetical protein
MHQLLALLAIVGLAAVADEPQRNDDFPVTVVDHLQKPVAKAIVLSSTNTKDELKVFKTDVNGIAKLPSLTAPKCSLEVSAEGFRTTLWKGMPNTPQTIVMLPVTSGRTLIRGHKTVSDAWLSSEPLVFCKSGLPEFPIRTETDAGQDWSNNRGEFHLKSPHTSSTLLQKDPEPTLTLFAFERKYQYGCFSFVPLSKLGAPLELDLQSLVHLKTSYTFNSENPPRSFRWIIVDKEQRTLAETKAVVEASKYATLATLNCFLPAGEYELHCVDMIPEHDPVVIPFKLNGDVPSVSLEKRDMAPRMFAASDSRLDEVLEAPLFTVNDIDAPEGNWGTIYGRITADDATSRYRPELVAKANPGKGIPQGVPAEDLKVNAMTGGVENIFVWMSKRPASIHPDLIEPPTDPVGFGQKGFQFVPHTLVARTGQTISIANADAVVSNVHTYPLKNEPVNLHIAPGVMGPQAQKIKLTTAESLPFKVACDFQPWKSAYWLIVDHPYATKTNSEGDFVIPNLPPGEHEFRVWHERKGYIHRKLLIRVEAGKVTKVDFEPVSLVLP